MPEKASRQPLFFGDNYYERIRAQLPSVSEGERKAAEYILRNSAECAKLSVHELAKCCGCSSATIIRLCKRLGYEGYAELRLQIRDLAANFAKDNLSISAQDNPQSMKNKSLQFTQSNISETVKQLNDKDLDRASRILAKANRILFCAMGSACGVALAATNHFLSAGKDATFISDDLLQLRSVAHLGSNDVVIGVNYDGYSKAVADTLMLAQKVGATSVLITSFSDSLCAKYADIVLSTPLRNNQNALNFSTTTICQMLIFQILIAGMWQYTGETIDDKSAFVRPCANLKRYEKSVKDVRVDRVKL